jgi:hypothetical protein
MDCRHTVGVGHLLWTSPRNLVPPAPLSQNGGAPITAAGPAHGRGRADQGSRAHDKLYNKSLLLIDFHQNRSLILPLIRRPSFHHYINIRRFRFAHVILAPASVSTVRRRCLRACSSAAPQHSRPPHPPPPRGPRSHRCLQPGSGRRCWTCLPTSPGTWRTATTRGASHTRGRSRPSRRGCTRSATSSSRGTSSSRRHVGRTAWCSTGCPRASVTRGACTRCCSSTSTATSGTSTATSGTSKSMWVSAFTAREAGKIPE